MNKKLPPQEIIALIVSTLDWNNKHYICYGFSSHDFSTLNCIILVDDQELMMVLENRITLKEMLRIKRQTVARTRSILHRIQ